MAFGRLQQHLVVRGEIVELAEDGLGAGIDDGALGLRPRKRFDGLHGCPAADHQDLDAIAALGLADAQAQKALELAKLRQHGTFQMLAVGAGVSRSGVGYPGAHDHAVSLRRGE